MKVKELAELGGISVRTLHHYDERFTCNIDKFGEGLAKFMSEAMAIYANKNKK